MTATATSPELIHTAHLHQVTQRARAIQRFGMVFDRADRTRDRWEERWARRLAQTWPKPEYGGDLDIILAAGESYHTQVEKGPYWDAIRRALRNLFGRQRFEQRAKDGYMELAIETSEDAGQHTLDTLGLNATFRWTSPRDMPRDMFGVRGSKIIQDAYGNHIDKLREIIIEATDPANPQSQTRIRRRIQDEWDQLTRKQVERIARTESAAVWETMNYNTARANEVTSFDWLIARGPSIGPPRSLPVCKRCLAMGINGPYGPGVELPPKHPHCRCTVIPALEDDWLPPATTWSGGPNPPLPLVPAPLP